MSKYTSKVANRIKKTKNDVELDSEHRISFRKSLKIRSFVIFISRVYFIFIEDHLHFFIDWYHRSILEKLDSKRSHFRDFQIIEVKIYQTNVTSITFTPLDLLKRS